METGLMRKSADNGAVSAELPKGEVRVSVRNLVEFILRGGDIDNRHQTSPENAMQEGSRIHRMIQKRMGAEYQSEVFLRYTHLTEQYTLVVEGRADGVIDTENEIISLTIIVSLFSLRKVLTCFSNFSISGVRSLNNLICTIIIICYCLLHI